MHTSGRKEHNALSFLRSSSVEEPYMVSRHGQRNKEEGKDNEKNMDA
jgi:hypothetical protein